MKNAVGRVKISLYNKMRFFMKSRLIGDRAFYSRALRLAVPIMIQNGITNFVNMLDNLMVGAVGTAAMTGVAVANQLVFIFNLCIYGAILR